MLSTGKQGMVVEINGDFSNSESQQLKVDISCFILTIC